jgi:hypothetical protein
MVDSFAKVTWLYGDAEYTPKANDSYYDEPLAEYTSLFEMNGETWAFMEAEKVYNGSSWDSTAGRTVLHRVDRNDGVTILQEVDTGVSGGGSISRLLYLDRNLNIVYFQSQSSIWETNLNTEVTTDVTSLIKDKDGNAATNFSSNKDAQGDFVFLSRTTGNGGNYFGFFRRDAAGDLIVESSFDVDDLNAQTGGSFITIGTPFSLGTPDSRNKRIIFQSSQTDAYYIVLDRHTKNGYVAGKILSGQTPLSTNQAWSGLVGSDEIFIPDQRDATKFDIFDITSPSLQDFRNDTPLRTILAPNFPPDDFLAFKYLALSDPDTGSFVYGGGSNFFNNNSLWYYVIDGNDGTILQNPGALSWSDGDANNQGPWNDGLNEFIRNAPQRVGTVIDKNLYVRSRNNYANGDGFDIPFAWARIVYSITSPSVPISPSASLFSPSISLLSASPSISLSTSPSLLSASTSNLSASPSVSFSPSRSQSHSPSISYSISPSLSLSISNLSASASISFSPSTSLLSASPSVFSASPSPVVQDLKPLIDHPLEATYLNIPQPFPAPVGTEYIITNSVDIPIVEVNGRRIVTIIVPQEWTGTTWSNTGRNLFVGYIDPIDNVTIHKIGTDTASVQGIFSVSEEHNSIYYQGTSGEASLIFGFDLDTGERFEVDVVSDLHGLNIQGSMLTFGFANRKNDYKYQYTVQNDSEETGSYFGKIVYNSKTNLNVAPIFTINDFNAMFGETSTNLNFYNGEHWWTDDGRSPVVMFRAESLSGHTDPANRYNFFYVRYKSDELGRYHHSSAFPGHTQHTIIADEVYYMEGTTSVDVFDMLTDNDMENDSPVRTITSPSGYTIDSVIGVDKDTILVGNTNPGTTSITNFEVVDKQNGDLVKSVQWGSYPGPNEQGCIIRDTGSSAYRTNISGRDLYLQGQYTYEPVPGGTTRTTQIRIRITKDEFSPSPSILSASPSISAFSASPSLLSASISTFSTSPSALSISPSDASVSISASPSISLSASILSASPSVLSASPSISAASPSTSLLSASISLSPSMSISLSPSMSISLSASIPSASVSLSPSPAAEMALFPMIAAWNQIDWVYGTAEYSPKEGDAGWEQPTAEQTSLFRMNGKTYVNVMETHEFTSGDWLPGIGHRGVIYELDENDYSTVSNKITVEDNGLDSLAQLIYLDRNKNLGYFSWSTSYYEVNFTTGAVTVVTNIVDESQTTIPAQTWLDNQDFQGDFTMENSEIGYLREDISTGNLVNEIVYTFTDYNNDSGNATSGFFTEQIMGVIDDTNNLMLLECQVLNPTGYAYFTLHRHEKSVTYVGFATSQLTDYTSIIGDEIYVPDAETATEFQVYDALSDNGTFLVDTPLRTITAPSLVGTGYGDARYLCRFDLQNDEILYGGTRDFGGAHTDFAILNRNTGTITSSPGLFTEGDNPADPNRGPWNDGIPTFGSGMSDPKYVIIDRNLYTRAYATYSNGPAGNRFTWARLTVPPIASPSLSISPSVSLLSASPSVLSASPSLSLSPSTSILSASPSVLSASTSISVSLSRSPSLSPSPA